MRQSVPVCPVCKIRMLCIGGPANELSSWRCAKCNRPSDLFMVAGEQEALNEIKAASLNHVDQ